MGAFNEILIQAAAYGAVMVFTIFGLAVFFRGYFWKYIKVRTSFGKYLMVKVRTPLRDYFAVGWVEENFLVYKVKDTTGTYTIRIAINTNDKIVYRCMAVNWVDIDEEKNAICKANYEPITGYDAKKFSDLLTRALMRPVISSGQEKIILVCAIAAAILAGVAVYLGYLNYDAVQKLTQAIPSIVNSAMAQGKGTVIASAALG
jgi:hypothetical protein